MISFPDMRNNRKVSNSSPTGNLDNAFRTLDPWQLFDASRVKERGYYEMCSFWLQLPWAKRTPCGIEGTQLNGICDSRIQTHDLNTEDTSCKQGPCVRVQNDTPKTKRRKRVIAVIQILQVIMTIANIEWLNWTDSNVVVGELKLFVRFLKMVTQRIFVRFHRSKYTQKAHPP